MGGEERTVSPRNKKRVVFKNKMLIFNYEDNHIVKKARKKKKEVTDDRVPKAAS